MFLNLIQVVHEYLNKKENFLLEVCNSPSLLEEITGLKKMKQEADEIEWESNIDDDF